MIGLVIFKIDFADYTWISIFPGRKMPFGALLESVTSMDLFDDVRRMNKRQLYYQILNFGMIVSSALMIWKVIS